MTHTQRLTVSFLLVALLLGFGIDANAQTTSKLPDSLRTSALSAEEDNLQDLLDGLGYSIDVANDELGWETFCAPGGFNTATMILEVAGSSASAHSGYYEAGVAGSQVELFDAADGPGSSVTFTINPSITDIGFYMEPRLNNPTNVWYSETALNTDSYDHMWVFPTGTPKHYIIAFEDLPDGGDGDYQDLVIKVVFDYVDPVLHGCPADITVECDAIPAPAVVTATADCDPNPTVEFTETVTPGVCDQQSIILRKWTATDKWGGTAVCSQIITVVDTTPPVVVTCPPTVTVDCLDDVPVADPALVVATDNCDPSPVVTWYSDTDDNNSCPKTLTRAYKVLDACGNGAWCYQTIIIDDQTPPVLSGCPVDITVECDAIPAPANVTATDNCEGLTLDFVETETAGACAHEKVLTRTWTATDACGNTASCSQTVTVLDSTVPVITACPAAVVVDCPTDVPAPNVALVTATDNCDPSPVVTFVGDVSDGQSCPETITRTYKVTDACGNEAFCYQTITVDDQTPPTITCPPDITVDCMTDVPQPNPALVAASDDCDPTPVVTFVSDVSSGGECPATITRTYKAVDACDNEAICTQIITVNDQTPPDVTCPANLTVECLDDVPAPDPSSVTVFDNCDPNPVVVHVSDNQVGSCPTLIYRVYKATDDCGNEASCEQIITVDDQTPPVLAGCPQNVTVSCDAIPAPAAVSATDNCDGVTLDFSETTTPGACDYSYVLTRTWTATDVCGNQAQCSQIVTVTDDIAPQITCPANVTVSCFGDVPSPATGLGAVVVSDNCDPAPVVTFVSDVQNGTGCPLTIDRTFRVVDACDNEAFCTQVITVDDQEPPVLTGCPSDVTVDCGNVPAVAVVTATDNCDGTLTVDFSEVLTPGNCVYNSIITRTWSATDQCGNVAVCVQVITVSDQTPPEITCPDPVTVECYGDVPVPDVGLVTAVDNCDPDPLVEFVGDNYDTQQCPGTVTRTYRAVDVCGNESFCTQIITMDDQTPPVFTVWPGDQDISQCEPTEICLDIEAEDNCPGSITYTATGGGAIVGGQWCYTPTGAASFDVTIVAEDSCGSIVQDIFHVDIVVNRAPTFTTCPDDATIHWGDTFVADLSATDPDPGQTLVYSLCEGAPEGATIDPGTGHFEWPSTAEDICDPTICVIVTDDCGATDMCEFDICVTNDPPVITCPDDVTICHGFAFSGQTTATDPDGGPYLFYYLESGPEGVMVDANTGEVTWAVPEPGAWEICVLATDSAAVCDPCSPANADTCCFTLNVVALDLVIEKVHDQIQGQMVEVSVDFMHQGGNWPIAGYNLLFQYDPTALAFLFATEGTFFTDCEWEYFTYRYGPNGNCFDHGACPSGVVRIVAIAESTGGNIANHPDCYTNDGIPVPGPGATTQTQLANLTFLVSDDRTLECTFAPIRFLWYECGDNGLSNVAGDTLHISNRVFDYAGEDFGTGLVDWNEITGLDMTFPTLTGAPAPDCDLSDKYELVRCAGFYNGGVDIICADSIDAPGDINLNGLPYEISDAVMLTNYFIQGLNAFPSNPEFGAAGSVAASDTNRDGITLSVADLVYLIRVVVGDAYPYAKETPVPTIEARYALDDGVLTITDDTRIGGAAIVVSGSVEPQLLGSSMALQYGYDGVNTRIVLTSSLDAAQAGSVTGSILAGLNGDLISLEMATAEGLPIAAKNVPVHYTLRQNYPNPFNPGTIIEFSLPEASDYSLTIYNIQGQVVDIINGQADAPGDFSIEWNGSGHASGVYLYRLDANNFTQTRKMLMLK